MQAQSQEIDLRILLLDDDSRNALAPIHRGLQHYANREDLERKPEDFGFRYHLPSVAEMPAINLLIMVNDQAHCNTVHAVVEALRRGAYDGELNAVLIDDAWGPDVTDQSGHEKILPEILGRRNLDRNGKLQVRVYSKNFLGVNAEGSRDLSVLRALDTNVKDEWRQRVGKLQKGDAKAFSDWFEFLVRNRPLQRVSVGVDIANGFAVWIGERINRPFETMEIKRFILGYLALAVEGKVDAPPSKIAEIFRLRGEEATTGTEVNAVWHEVVKLFTPLRVKGGSETVINWVLGVDGKNISKAIRALKLEILKCGHLQKVRRIELEHLADE